MPNGKPRKVFVQRAGTRSEQCMRKQQQVIHAPPVTYPRQAAFALKWTDIHDSPDVPALAQDPKSALLPDMPWLDMSRPLPLPSL